MRVEARLQQDGATYRSLEATWAPDAADVHRRSGRQRQRARRALSAAAALVIVLGIGIGALGLRAANRSGDQVLDSGGPGSTTVTSAPVASTAAPTGTAAQTTSTMPPTTPPSADVPTTPPPAPTSAPTPTGPTTAAPTTAPRPSTTTTAVAPANAVTLRGDGLGVAKFGEPEQVVMARLIVALGMPSADYGWREANTGIEERAHRQVAWEGFIVSFLEDERGRYFAGWRYSVAPWSEHDDAATPVLSTPDGLRVGMTWVEVSPRVKVDALVSGEGASGYRVQTGVGPLYLWFDPAMYQNTNPPAPSARVVILDAGDPMSAHDP